MALLQTGPQRTSPAADPDTVPAAAAASRSSSLPAAVLCDGLPVSAVTVETRRPRFRGPLAIWRRVASRIGLHNTETREGVVRRFLTLDRGDTCTEFRRAESERLLRAQPFIATASVRAVPDGAGGVRLVVETVDEVPPLVAGRYRAGDWALAAGNENVFGTGSRILIRAEQRAHYRNGFGIEVEHRQLLGRPYTLGVQAVRHSIGERWELDLGHAFLTDLQRVAWHTGFFSRQDYAHLKADTGGAHLALPLRQSAWDIGGVVRLGPPGRAFLSGGVLTGERLMPQSAAVLVSDTGFTAAAPADAAVAAHYAPARSVRANAVAGFRSVRYRRGAGFDALTATQDLANGIQVSTIVGKSIPRVSPDNDGFVAANLFLGHGGPWSYGAMQLEGEARRSFERPITWDAILGSARAAWYIRPAERLTSIASVEWAGGWRGRFPLLLDLGDRQGGVRGFGGADVAGARRAVGRLEERWVIGPVAGRGDLGVALFSDVGRVWAGDAPFGTSSEVAASVGFSVLAAVPVGGQRLYRVDVAFPVRGPGRHALEIRFGGSDPTRHFWQAPDDVTRARSAAIPQRIFEWP